MATNHNAPKGTLRLDTGIVNPGAFLDALGNNAGCAATAPAVKRAAVLIS